MNRSEFRNLFKRHHGSIKQVAEKAEVCSESVSRWLKGETNSIPIESAVLHIAKGLLANDAKIEALRANLSNVTGETAGEDSVPVIGIQNI